MKYLMFLITLGFITSCELRKPEQRFYKATAKNNVALLSLSIDDNQFYGQYKVRYSENIIDSGEVRGVLDGDTLRGRFKYLSYGGVKEVKPFLLLRRGDTLKLGNGVAYTYMKIPYYIPKSIEFRDSNFQFLPISEAAFKQSDFKMSR
ncbi:hypothetical protein ABGT15_02150 [Flavobacterium enshiense]|uniref:hypothetical protein n=1 Tax=Flavobacterium enshiense TaxID=1341165 RepID=UPI00345D379D